MPETYRSQSQMSSALLHASHDSDQVAAVRPRNRRNVSSNVSSNPAASSASSLLDLSPLPSRGVSPLPSERLGAPGNRSGRASPANTTGFGKGLLEGSWAPTWSSVQEFASSILTGETDSGPVSARPDSRNGRSKQKPLLPRGFSSFTSIGSGGTNSSKNWGPEPPPKSRIRAEDIGAGSLAERDAALRAAKTASVLESHPGVNGGLDITGKYKHRTSDELPRGYAQDQETEECLVYIHHVQRNDTYAGIVLKYRCQEDTFRKANGLWSRDNIQVRKWLALPVDACEIRGRPCDPPSSSANHVDLLAPTPEENSKPAPEYDDFFSPSCNGKATEPAKPEEEPSPWTHVRWDKVDGINEPVEIARVSRRSIGYFPPRRKKSLRTVSACSTPRGSVDLPRHSISSPEAVGSPAGSAASRRESNISGRPHPSVLSSSGTPSSARSRGGSGGPADSRPAWMRRPGGVGSMGRNVHAPGPEKDYLNSWTRKHIPGLNIESLPSMSVMGSESLRFGFKRNEPASIVESPYTEGQDAEASSRQGTGLDQAAATVEKWLRGAWAKRPGTPILGPHRRAPDDADLIELMDTGSDDGRGTTGGGLLSGGDGGSPTLMGPGAYGSSGRSNGDVATRRVPGGGGTTRTKKSD